MTLQDRDVIAIVGAGQAGAELAFSLRRQGCRAAIILIGAEPHAPYQRPLLSKSYLQQGIAGSLPLRELAAYERAGIRLLLASCVTGIDRRARALQLQDGREIAYARLALTTGAAARRLSITGAEQAAQAGYVRYVRTLDDVQRIRERLAPGTRLAIIGGGFLGLEVAASARAMQVNVTVLESASRLLARVAGPQISVFYEDAHRAAGVDVRTDVVVTGLDLQLTAGVVEVSCADGPPIVADLVIIAAGSAPSIQLAQTAGLDVDDGIVVDEHMRTSDSDIVAAGDCASAPDQFSGRRTRLESVPSAIEQARVAAATLLDRPPPACSVPWFWSDQYDLKLQICGSTAGNPDTVMRGDPRTRSFTVFYMSAGRVLASESVNRPRDFMLARKWVASGASVERDLLADPSLRVSA